MTQPEKGLTPLFTRPNIPLKAGIRRRMETWKTDNHTRNEKGAVGSRTEAMTKPYSVSFDEEAGVVTVRVVGAATHKDHCMAREEALDLCRAKGCSRLLVDLRELSTERSSTMTCFSFGESLARAPQRLRLAHVLPKDLESRRDVKFTSTVEANRGMTSREFDSIEEAGEWLLS